MEESHIAALEAALSAGPTNRPLRFLLLRLYHEQGATGRAAALLEPLAPAPEDGLEERLLAAQVMLRAGQPQAVPTWVAGDTPHEQLLRAEAALALGQTAEAQRLYQAAVASNATLESPRLAALLAAEERGGGEGRPRLRVVANDDTRAEETVRLLQPPERSVTFQEVGGLDEVKKQIHRRIIAPFQRPSLFARFRRQVGGGILLYGPPGCGKTLLARATAGECNARFINVLISDVLDMYIGESEAKLHAIFNEARAHTPAVLFFDEVEALAGKRQYSREATASKLVSQFLSELDGFAQNNRGVLVLAATNTPWAVDPAFRRSGRFDRVVFIAPPDVVARREILRGLLAERPGGEAIDPAPLARATAGFSGADLRLLVESAVDEAIEASIAAEEELPLTMAQLQTALKDVRPTTGEWLTTARNYAKYANEAGQYDDVLAFIEKHGRGR